MKLHGRSVLVTDGKIAESNLISDLRDREFYEKPTTERKRKKSAAKNRWRKKLADQQLPRKLY